ncbi:hypothetical protein L218DRAFT_439429 [Marasmius fiardii PR-910]|nr:hypothetical protein L218DRAFT_439429 [Marasmius fiardii PR-910]
MDLPRGHREDFYMSSNMEQLRRLLDRLELAAPKEVLLRFRCAQRHILELDARIRWVAKYRARYGTPSGKDGPGLADEKIMGAFTDNLDELKNLFQLNIPVYYARTFSRAGDARINKVVPFIQPLFTQTINLHSGFMVDLSDATPTHRVIYTDLPPKPERYNAKANYIASIFEYLSVFGTSQPQSSTSTQMASLPLVPSIPTRQPSQGSSRGRLSPYSKALSYPPRSRLGRLL